MWLRATILVVASLNSDVFFGKIFFRANFFFGIKWTWGLITISICVFLTDVEHLFGYVSFIQASSSVTCPFM